MIYPHREKHTTPQGRTPPPLQGFEPLPTQNLQNFACGAEILAKTGSL